MKSALTNTPVERAIMYMWERYNEPLSLTDIARSAILSRFHFSRVFRDATGVTPGRFLSAVRIYQAKRMLLTTSMNITDISFSVGYNSLGSFTNHFTDSVGISPGRFRRISQNGGFEPPVPEFDPSPVHGAVAGTVSLPPGYSVARAYVGAFDTPIVQRRPCRAAIIDLDATGQPAHFQLTGIPAGTWYIHAVAVADTADPEPWARRTLLVGGHRSPVTLTEGAGAKIPIALRVRRATDLPILLALPDLEPQPEIVVIPIAEPVPAPDLASPPARS